MSGKPTRRSFFGHAGAALATPFAATVALAGERDGAGYVAGRLAALEDANAIRALLQDYAQRVSTGLQAAPAANVRDLRLDANAAVDVAANGTATVCVPCTVETATPIDGHETVVEMARLQGDGVVRRSERRLLAGTLVKRDGTWMLEQTELTA
ncbi:MAG TPA: hypothetical protein VIQ99_08020 [Gammaproteobacteria bacterium]